MTNNLNFISLIINNKFNHNRYESLQNKGIIHNSHVGYIILKAQKIGKR